MKDQVFRVEYFVHIAGDRPGEGGNLGNRFKQEGVNLLAMSAFPIEKGKVQVDIIPEHPEDLRKAAKKLNITLGEPKPAFLIQGSDRIGAMGEVMGQLGSAGINVKAVLGVCGGGDRYGALLWVDPKDVESASKILGATTMATHKV